MTTLNTKNPILNPKAIVFVNVLFTSCNSIFFKLSTVPAMVFVSYRFFLCALVFLGVLAIRAARAKRKLLEITPKRFAALFVIGFIFSFGAYVYFIALKKTALSSVLILTSSMSIFVVLFSFLFLKEKIAPRSLLAILLAFIGCIIVVMTKTNGLANSMIGNLCALLCAICSAIYMVSMKKFSDVHVPTKLFAVYTGSFVFAFIVAMIQGCSFLAFEDGTLFPPKEYLWVFCSAVLSVCIPQGIINWALKWVKATFVGSISLLEPIIGTFYGFLIWSERVSLNQVIGGICVIGGLYLYNLSEYKLKEKELAQHEPDENKRTD